MPLIILILSNCEKSKESNYYSNLEKDNIKEFLSKTGLNFEEKESGLYYIDIKKGDGITPESGDYVIYKYTLRLLDQYGPSYNR